MGMYCCCGVKKKEYWKCECDWESWNLCFAMGHDEDHLGNDIPIQEYPETEGNYLVRAFEDGDYHEEKSEFCLIPKNWGEETNQAISRWRIVYDDKYMGFKGVYAWKQKEILNAVDQ